jgi:hypothetical protein
MATSTLGNGTLVLAGTTSGTTTVTATAVAGTTTLTLPAATDTLVGKATTDTLTNKTLTGAVMNGTLGATTPSTVAATSISASTTLGVTGVATFSAGTAAAPAITTTGDTNTGIFFPAADTIAFAEGGAEVARINSSGNVGIGTASPSSRLTTSGATGTGNGLTIVDTDYSNDTHQIYGNNSLHISAGTGGAGAILFKTASSERARIDSSGNLLAGTTTALGLVTVARSTASSYNYASNAISNQPDHMGFFNGGTNTGSIQRNGGSGVSYVTTSDYRLKENIAPMTGALAKVTKLKPVTYTWKLDGSEGQGFIAHELAEVVPDCVAGDKDAVNEDGSIKPQGIDTSFLVATLTAAIQEQQALITTLTDRITALESA